jgi:hypothetical protein
MIESLFMLGLGLTTSRQVDYLTTAGLLLVIITAIVVVRTRQISLGNKQVWIPLATLWVIMLIASKWSYVLIITLALACAYITGRNMKLNDKANRTLATIIIAGSISIFVWWLLGWQTFGNDRVGGIFYHYNVAVGGLIMLTLLCRTKWQWLLTSVAVFGLFFTGAEETFVVIGMLLLAMLLRRDWGKKLLAPIGTIALLLAICTPLGITNQLYSPTAEKVATTKQVVAATPVGEVLAPMVPDSITKPLDDITKSDGVAGDSTTRSLLDKATGGRYESWVKATKEVKPFGKLRYEPTNLSQTSIHNVPLRILSELGVVALVCWLWVLGWGIFRSRMKYAFVAILALSLFDHFMWTSMGMFYWAVAGIATVAKDSDLIFRKERQA